LQSKIGVSSPSSSHILEPKLSSSETRFHRCKPSSSLLFSGSQAPSTAKHFVPEALSAIPLSSHAHSFDCPRNCAANLTPVKKHQGADCMMRGLVWWSEPRGKTVLSLLPSYWELIRPIGERIVIFFEVGVRVEVVEALVLWLNDKGCVQNCLPHFLHWRLRIH
jgi:hypothetical protein